MLDSLGPEVQSTGLPSNRVQFGPKINAPPGDYGVLVASEDSDIKQLSIDAMVRKHSEQIEELQHKVSVVLDMLQGGGKPHASVAVPPDASLSEGVNSKAFQPEASTVSSKSGMPTSGTSSKSTESDYDVDNHTLWHRTSHWQYHLRKSTWDGCLFFKTGIYGKFDSFMLFIVYFLNIGVSVILVFVIADNLTDGDFDDEEILVDLQDWRVIYAHDPEYADPFTSVSLGYSVCQLSTLLMEGTQQAEMFSNISEYLNPAFFGFSAGGVLCISAIILWVLTVVRRLSDVALFTFAVWTCKPTGDENVFMTGCLENHIQAGEIVGAITHKLEEVKATVTEQSTHVKFKRRGTVDEEQLLIEISVKRVVSATLFIVAPQVALAVALGFYGVKFLVATVELEELLLNAIALEVVLNIDELIFTTVAPETCISVMKKAAPLRIRRPKGGRDTAAGYAKFLILTGIMVAIGFGYVRPRVLTMREAERIMCGGDPDFLAVQLQTGPVVAGIPPSTDYDRGNLKYCSILQRSGLLTDGDPHGEGADACKQNTYPVYEGRPFDTASVANMNSWRARTLEDWASESFLSDTYLACVDDYYTQRFPHLRDATWKAMRATTGHMTASNCSDVKQYCYGWNSSLSGSVRLFCPITCGGHDMASGQFMDIPAHGMVQLCSNDRLKSLEQHDCTEPSAADLRLMPSWTTYLNSSSQWLIPIFSKFTMSNETLMKIWVGEYFNGAMEHGCDYFNVSRGWKSLVSGKTYGQSFCDVGGAFMLGKRTLRSMCPITCGCNTTVKAEYQYEKDFKAESQCPWKCWTR